MLPVSLTGDWARDYNFYFSLFFNPLQRLTKIKNLDSFKNIALASLKTLADVATLTYVSSLARKVSVPDRKLDTAQITLGTVETAVPVKFVLGSFTVDYFDDEANTVENFHVGWQSTVKSGFSYSLLSLCSLSCVMGTAKKVPILPGVDLPTGVTTYPQIFPATITRPDFDKGGTQLRTISVEYIRIPNIIIGDSKFSGLLETGNKISRYLSV